MRGTTIHRKRGKRGFRHSVEPLERRVMLAAVNVSGVAQWTDANGGVHAVPLATVEIRSTAEMNTDPALATCQTDLAGNFSGSFNFSSGVTVFARIFARNPSADVKPDTASPTTYSMDSSSQLVNAAGNVTLPTKVGSNTVVAEESFSIMAATLEAQTYTATLAVPLATMPSQRDIRFPSNIATNGSASFFTSTTGQLFITQRRVYDWDVIQHEYGHYVASIYHFDTSPGGNHSFQAASPKPGGDKLAWSEGWATYFAISAQRSVMASYASGVPNVGDTAYNPAGAPANTNPNYDLATGIGVRELDESSVASSLYHLAAGDQGIKISDKTIFQDLAVAQPTTLGAFWDSIAANRSGTDRSLIGKVLGLQNVAPVETAPADFSSVTAASPPTFTWTDQNSNDFQIQFFTNDFKKVVYATADLGNVKTFTPSADEWSKIFDGHTTVRWVVEGRDTTATETPGAVADQTYTGTLNHYWSTARTLNGPGITFVVDNTGSMSAEIGAVQSALDQFISDVQSSLAPGETPPTIDLVTFVDGPTDVISSNDLSAVKAAIDGMTADGGGDCPEPSAVSLQFAAQNVAPGGTILLITDASSDAGSDLTGTIDALRARGVRVNAFISGDCSNTDEVSAAATSSIVRAATSAAQSCCDNNSVSGTSRMAVSSYVPTITGSSATLTALSQTASPIFGPADGFSTTDGPEPPVTPTNDAGQTPIDFGGNSTTTATPLTVNAPPVSGVLGDTVVNPAGGTTTNSDDYYQFQLTAGTAYNIVVRTDGTANVSAILVGTDGTTQLGIGTTILGDPGFGGATIPFTPTTTGTYFLHVGQPDSQTGYSVQVSDNPIVGTQSSFILYSTAATQTGGAFVFDDAIAGSPTTADTTSYTSSIRNVMDSTFEPAVLSASPGLLPLGQSMVVTLTARGTNWIQGSTHIAFSNPGITVNSVTVNSSTSLTASVTIAAGATVGFSDVIANTKLGSNTETARGTNAVQVSPAPSSAILLQVQPGVLVRGQSATVTVVGALTHWDSTATLSLGPGITVTSLTVDSASHLTAQIHVDAAAAIGFRIGTVMVTTGAGETDSQDRAIMVQASALASVPSVLTLTPAHASLGSHTSVTVVGSNTNFAAGVTTANFGAGVTVDSVVITDATHAVVTIDVAPGAAAGFRDVTLTTGAEQATVLAGLFLEPRNIAVLALDGKGTGLAISGRGSVSLGVADAVIVNSANKNTAANISSKGGATAMEFDITGGVKGKTALHGTLKQHVAQTADPFASIAAPTRPSASFKKVHYSKHAALTLQPGVYTGGISISGNAQVTLAPGIYYIIGGGFSISGSATVTGNGVLIYTLGKGGLNVSGRAHLTLTPFNSGTAAGISYFQDRKNRSADIISGRVDLAGVFYASAAKVSISGFMNESQTPQLIVYDLNVTGKISHANS